MLAYSKLGMFAFGRLQKVATGRNRPDAAHRAIAIFPSGRERGSDHVYLQPERRMRLDNR